MAVRKQQFLTRTSRAKGRAGMQQRYACAQCGKVVDMVVICPMSSFADST